MANEPRARRSRDTEKKSLQKDFPAIRQPETMSVTETDVVQWLLHRLDSLKDKEFESVKSLLESDEHFQRAESGNDNPEEQEQQPRATGNTEQGRSILEQLLKLTKDAFDKATNASQVSYGHYISASNYLEKARDAWKQEHNQSVEGFLEHAAPRLDRSERMVSYLLAFGDHQRLIPAVRMMQLHNVPAFLPMSEVSIFAAAAVAVARNWSCVQRGIVTPMQRSITRITPMWGMEFESKNVEVIERLLSRKIEVAASRGKNREVSTQGLESGAAAAASRVTAAATASDDGCIVEDSIESDNDFVVPRRHQRVFPPVLPPHRARDPVSSIESNSSVEVAAGRDVRAVQSWSMLGRHTAESDVVRRRRAPRLKLQPSKTPRTDIESTTATLLVRREQQLQSRVDDPEVLADACAVEGASAAHGSQHHPRRLASVVDADADARKQMVAELDTSTAAVEGIADADAGVALQLDALKAARETVQRSES